VRIEHHSEGLILPSEIRDVFISPESSSTVHAHRFDKPCSRDRIDDLECAGAIHGV